MGLTKWQTIVVEWVNCLNLCKTITSVNDLKNGAFFNILLCEILQTDPGSCNSIPSSDITDFLKKHFPGYSLDSETVLSADKVEVTYICSLLIYYCCMIDRRPDFIKPLCDHLTPSTQFYLKTFLEDLECSDITRDVLKESIVNIHKSSTTPVKCCQISPYASPLKTNNTPLLEFFKTPLKKYQLNFDLHKKEIKTLIAQLDLERFEKADIQEELKLQYEKNKILDKKVAAKRQEISRLRSELLSLESKSPPSFNKTEGKLENKRLKDEITSLEKYVEILQQEQEDLQIERDNTRTRLLKVEDQYNELQGKNLHTERYCAKLTEEKHQHLQELCFLREKCEELTTILSELQRKNSCDESYEMDVSQSDLLCHNKSGSIDLESLAQTVVDVQLVDAQEENKTLRKQLIELEVNSTELTDQVSELRTRISKVLDENTVLLEDNCSLNDKVSILMETQNQLEETKLELQQSSNQFYEVKQTLDAAIENLYSKLASTESTLNKSQQENQKLLTELRICTDKNNNLTGELYHKTTEYNQIIIVNTELDSKLKDAIAKCLAFESKNHILNMSLENLQNDLQNCLVQLAQELQSSADEDNQKTGIEALKALISVIQIKNCEHAKYISDLQQNCETLTSKIVELNSEIMSLNSGNLNLQTKVAYVSDCLTKAEEKVQEFETVTIVNYDKLIDNYKFMIEDKNRVILDLNKLEVDVLDRDNRIRVLDEDKIQLNLKLKCLIDELSKDKSIKIAIEDDCDVLKNIIEERNQSFINLERDKYNLESQLSTLETDLIERNSSLELLTLQKLQHNELLVEKDQIINNLTVSKSKLQEMLENLEKVLHEEQKAKEELEQRCGDLNEILITKNTTIANLKTELQCEQLNTADLERYSNRISEIVNTKENIIADLTKQLGEERKTKNQLKQDRDQMAGVVITKDKTITYLEKQLLDEQQTKEQLKQSYQQLSEIIITKDNNIMDMKKQLRDEINNKEQLEHTFKQTSANLIMKDNTIADLQLEILNRSKHFEILEIESTNMKTHKEELETHLSLVQQQIIAKDDHITHLKIGNNDLNKQLQTLENEMVKQTQIKQELDVICEDLTNSLTKKDTQIQILESNILGVNDQIDILNSKLQMFETEIINEKHLKNESEKCQLQLQETFDTKEENYKVDIANQKMLVQKLQDEVKAITTNIHVLSLDIFDTSDKTSDTPENVINKLKNNILSLKQRLQLAMTEKEEAIEESTAYGQKLEKIKQQYRHLQETVVRTIEELNSNLTLQLHNKNSSDQIEFNELNNLKLVEESQNALLEDDQNELSDMFKKITGLQNNIKHLLDEKSRADSEINTYKEQINALEILVKAIEETAKNEQEDLTSICSNLKENNTQLELRIKGYRDEINRAQASHLDILNNMTELSQKHQNDIINYDYKISVLETQNSELKKDLDTLQTVENNLNSELINVKTQLQQSIVDYKSTIDAEEIAKHKCEIEVVAFNKKLHDLTQSYSELQQTQSETVLKLEQTINLAEMEKNHSSELERIISGLKIDNSDLNTKLQSQIDQLLNEKEKLKTESSNIYSQLTGIKELNENLEQQITELKIKLDEFNYQKLTLNIEITNLNNKLQFVEDTKQQLDVCHRDYVDFNNLKLSEVKSEHELQLKTSKTEIMDLNSKLEETKQLLLDLETSKDILKQETCSIIQDKESKIQKLQREITYLKQNLDLITQDKILIQTKLDELTMDLKEFKSTTTEDHLKLETQETEIKDTKDKLEHVLTMVQIVTEMLERELDKTSDKISNETQMLNNSKENFNNELLIKENITVKVQNEVSNLKFRIEDVLSVKTQIESKLELINEKYTELEQKKEQESRNYEIKLQEVQQQHNENLKFLEHTNKQIIENLEHNVTQKDSIIHLKLDEISNLNLRFIQAITNCEKLESEKTNLIQKFNQINLELIELKQQRDLLDESQKTLRKEMELSILRGHESIDTLKLDFIKRFEIIDRERTNEIEAKKQLENFINNEQKQIQFLEKRIRDLSNERDKSILLCSESNQHIHDLYYLIIQNEKNNKICEQILKLKERETGIEDKLQLLYVEKELVDEECLKISDNFSELLDNVSKHDLMQSDYNVLKEKYHTLSACESENNSLKSKISELEFKLSDLQLENVKYQKVLSDEELTKETKQKEHNSIKDRYEEELNFMKQACENRQLIIKQNENEHTSLKHEYQLLKTKNEELLKHEKEFKTVQHSNLSLQNLVMNFEHKIIDFEKLIQQKDVETNIFKKKNTDLAFKSQELETKLNDCEQKSIKYKQTIEDCEAENNTLTKKYHDLSEHLEKSNDDTQELNKLKSMYMNLKADHSRLEMEVNVMRKTLEDRNAQLSELSLIKDAYAKILEENNKNNLELDTLRYSKRRDKEEYKRLLLEERSKGGSNSKVDAQVQEVRHEYEEKLKKMKDKIMRLYKDEIDKKEKARQQDHMQSEETIASLKSQLWMTGNKYVELKNANEKLMQKLKRLQPTSQQHSLEASRSGILGSRESITSLHEPRCVNRNTDERRLSTLPKNTKIPSTTHMLISAANANVLETVTISRRTSVTSLSNNLDHGLRMEDEEGELFSNSNLTDLMSGRCEPTTSRDTRLSELQYRNSLCLPHLKSSYPAETQFFSPSHCKEDDVKANILELDDSMSSSLLPGERPRMKKDRGQTMYKKPGPPTPSKNGGRASLQGNEIQPRDILREYNDNARAQEARPGKPTSTPSRIKALFTRSSISNNTENQSSTPRGKRRSIFRR